MSEISDKILNLIEEKNISYGELSKISGIPKSALQRYATGKTNKISAQRLKIIAESLGTTVQYLINEESPNKISSSLSSERKNAMFYDRIRYQRESQGMTQQELADKVGYTSRSTINKIEKGERNITGDKIQAIAQALGVKPSYLMDGDTYDNTIDIFSINGINPIPKTYKRPRLGTIACGEPILAEENIEAYDDIPDSIKCDFTLICKGDSMVNARINDGDIVYIKQQSQVDNGEIAAVLIDNEATLKRVYIYEDKVVLQPENTKYPPFVYTKEDMNNIRILGKAVGFTSLLN